MTRYFAPPQKAATRFKASTSKKEKCSVSIPNPSSDANTEPPVVRFTLKSGRIVEMQTESIDEVVDVMAGHVCRMVTGVGKCGGLVAVPFENIDMMQEAQ